MSGADNPRGQNFDVNRIHLSLRSFATSFKKISFKYDCIQFFFHYFIHVYSPGAGPDNPFRIKFWCQQEHLVTSVIYCKFQKNLFEVWFYTFFFMILYMYIATGQGRQLPGDKVWFQQKCLVTSFICCKFKKKCLWSLILSNFFHVYYMHIAPGQG